MEKLVITNKGKELLTSLVAGNKTITFTRVDISAHDYKRGEIEGLTALDEIKQTSAVSDVERIRHDVIRVKAAVDNRDVNGGYYIRAVGLYVRMDEIEYLFGVSINPQPDFMPAKSQTVTGLNLSFNIKVDSTEHISVVVSSEAYASAEQVAAMRVEVDEKLEEVRRMKTRLEGSVEGKVKMLEQTIETKIEDFSKNFTGNVLSFATDYKMFGEKSYVFLNKNFLRKLFDKFSVSMNDKGFNGEALEYVLTEREGDVGLALSEVFDIESKEEIKLLTAMNAVLASSTAMNAVLASSTAMNAVAASSTAMNAVAASGRKFYYWDGSGNNEPNSYGYSKLNNFSSFNSQGGKVFVLTGRVDDSDSREMSIRDALGRNYRIFSEENVSGGGRWDYKNPGFNIFALPITVGNIGGSNHGICGVIL